MKKLITAVFITFFAAVSSFAIDLSAGGLFDITPTFDVLSAKENEARVTMTASQIMLGFKGFFDAQYVTVLAGIDGTVGKQKTKLVIKDPGFDQTYEGEGDSSVIYFNIGVLGKYPFKLGIAKLYPLAGFDFDIPLTAKGKTIDGDPISKEYIADNLHRYWFDLGFGADVFVAGKLFIRPQAVFGVQMNQAKYLKDEEKSIKDSGGTVLVARGFKFTISLGIGYQF